MKEPTATDASQYFGRVFALLASTDITQITRTGELRELSLDQGTQTAVEIILETGRNRGKVMLVGNGGSASIAGHMQMDLCNRAHVRSLVFNDPPVLTALSNDHGYNFAFERLVRQYADPGDLLIAISSSGQSENILRAARAADELDCQVLTMSGFKTDNPLRQLGDLNFHIASSHYGEVEVAHHTLGHFLTDCAVEYACQHPGHLPEPEVYSAENFQIKLYEGASEYTHARIKTPESPAAHKIADHMKAAKENEKKNKKQKASA